MCAATSTVPISSCAWEAASPKTLLVTSAYDIKTLPSPGDPLPKLREDAHDSALITIVSIDAYRGERYQPVDVYRQRNDTGARKPDTIAVRFASGTSSARLSGSVSTGWYDSYTFDANRAQTLTIGDVASKGKLLITVEIPQQNGASLPVTLGVPVKLPASGTYRVLVDTDSEADQRYALTLSVR